MTYINVLFIFYSCLSDSDTEEIQDIHSTNYEQTKSTRNNIGYEPY